MRFPDARILIFAKAPQRGRVKTRLMPVLGAEGACALHERLLYQTVERCCRAALAPVELWCTPGVDHPAFERLAASFRLERFAQQGADLGERMAHAARAAFRRANRVLLIGTDAPALAPGHLQEALLGLEHAVVMMAPAEDGGYVLLGLRRPVPELFERMPWGSDRVAMLTRRRCAAQGLPLHELETLWDVDRPEDLARLGGISALAEADAASG